MVVQSLSLGVAVVVGLLTSGGSAAVAVLITAMGLIGLLSVEFAAANRQERTIAFAAFGVSVVLAFATLSRFG